MNEEDCFRLELKEDGKSYGQFIRKREKRSSKRKYKTNKKQYKNTNEENVSLIEIDTIIQEGVWSELHDTIYVDLLGEYEKNSFWNEKYYGLELEESYKESEEKMSSSQIA